MTAAATGASHIRYQLAYKNSLKMSILENLSEFVFGKGSRNIWEQFASEKKGVLKSESGDLFVEYNFLNFIFKIKNYNYRASGSSHEKSYMVGMIEFVNPTKFELSITKEDFFTRIYKIFKNNEIKIGDNVFDKSFYIKSNKGLKAISILKNKLLSEKIISIKPTRIEISNNGEFFGEVPKKGKYILYFAIEEAFLGLSQLNEIHSVLVLFSESLKENCQIE